MLRLQRLDHVTITTRDVARSVAFYRDLLGLLPGPEWPGEVTMLACGDSYLAIAHWAEGAKVAPQPAITVDHLAFRVDAASYRRATAELLAAGVAIDHESDHGICQSLYLRDPDGHLVELCCYDIPGRPEKLPVNRDRGAG
jgi:catechol 2,3-dioxygenase-like lactoylglutathione lyase family enzyme